MADRTSGRPIADVPEFAETTFQAMCDRHGAIRNKAIQDRAGWDFLVEFERSGQRDVPLDEQAGTSTARVQVKSKVRGTPFATLKLSNAVRFAREPDFCFVVLFQLQPDGSSYRLYARHFHEELIERTLKRVREEELGRRSALNTVQLRVPFSKNDDHTDDLLEWMSGICDTDPVRYAADKQRLERTVGFDANSLVASVSFASLDPTRFVDHMLGLSPPPLPVERVTLTKRRFGMSDRLPLHEQQRGAVTLRLDAKPAIIRMTTDTGAELEVEGEFRAFGLPGLPSGNVKASCVADPFTVVIGPEQSPHLLFDFMPENRYPLPLLAAIGELMGDEQDARVEVRVRGAKGNVATFLVTLNGSENRGYYGWLAEVGGALARCGGAKLALRPVDIEAASGPVSHFTAALAGQDMVAAFHLPPPIPVPADAMLRYFVVVEVDGNIFHAVCERALKPTESPHDARTYAWGAAAILECGVDKGDRGRLTDRLRRRLIHHHARSRSFTMTLMGGELDLLGGVEMTAHGTPAGFQLVHLTPGDLLRLDAPA